MARHTNTENEPMISVENVSKIFNVPHEKKNSIKDYFLNPFHKTKNEAFKALDNVNFNVKKGEFIGIIGRNGSGKSTLLKILAQIYAPTKGKIVINGSLVPFLELGVGFNPELNGRENIYLNGTILGMSRKFLKEKFNEIVDFAEIREFIDLPVKRYSSGMLVRLAFSVAVQARADIYLLDEILAVGDISFQKKSLSKMEELLSGGATVVLVSHAVASVKQYCKRIIILEHGEVIFNGDVETGLNKYLDMMNK